MYLAEKIIHILEIVNKLWFNKPLQLAKFAHVQLFQQNYDLNLTCKYNFVGKNTGERREQALSIGYT